MKKSRPRTEVTRNGRPKKKPATPRKREWKPQFLRALGGELNVSRAAQLSGVDRRTVYSARESDAAFAQAWDDIVETHLDRHEAEISRRGFRGWDEPVFQGGMEVGTVRKYSDALAMFYLKAKRPAFRDKLDLTSRRVLTKEIEHLVTDEELDQFIEGKLSKAELAQLIESRKARPDAVRND